MKAKIFLLPFLIPNALLAGTPDNSDVSYLYAIALTIVGIILGTDALKRYIKARMKKNQDLLIWEDDLNA